MQDESTSAWHEVERDFLEVEYRTVRDRQMKELEKVNEKLLKFSNGMNRLVINYEDFANWDTLLLKTESFLSVKPITMQPVLQKVGAGRWQDEVENYKEIEQLLLQNNFTEYIEQ